MFEDSAFLHKLAFGSIALNKAVIAVAPQTARQKQRLQMQKNGIDETDLYNWGEADVNNYIEAYDCRPPPIFIPLITFAQVNRFKMNRQKTVISLLRIFFLQDIF